MQSKSWVCRPTQFLRKFYCAFSPALGVKDKVSTPPVHTLMDDMNQADVSYTQGLTDLPMSSTQARDPSNLFNCKYIIMLLANCFC